MAGREIGGWGVGRRGDETGGEGMRRYTVAVLAPSGLTPP